MSIKIFCDIADVSLIKKFNKKKVVKGFTTNPSLMRKAFLIRLGLVVNPLTTFFLLNFLIKETSAISQKIFILIKSTNSL